MCAHAWQDGGGLYIFAATLTNTNVYDNQAHDVRSTFELFKLSSSAPLERYMCAHAWQDGGGLYIFGTATLTNTNVYDNQAHDVRSTFELFKLSSSAPLVADRCLCVVCGRG